MPFNVKFNRDSHNFVKIDLDNSHREKAIKQPESESIKEIFHRTISRLVKYLFEKDLTFLGATAGAFLAEPLETMGVAYRTALSAIFGYNFFGINPDFIDEKDLDKKPILMIHGNYHDPSAWQKLAEKLQKNGELGPIFHVAINVGKFNKKDKEIIKNKVKEIQRLYKSHGRKNVKVDLIGHSRGSTLALMGGFEESEWEIPETQEQMEELEKRNWWYMEDEQGRIYCRENPVLRKDIGKIIMLGNPLTQEQFENAATKRNDLYEIYGKWDVIVTNKPQAEVDPEHLLEADCGHLGLLTADKVHDKIINWLLNKSP